MLCSTCSNTLYPDTHRCGRCGAAVIDGGNLAGRHREWPASTPASTSAELTATVDRSRLAAVPPAAHDPELPNVPEPEPLRLPEAGRPSVPEPEPLRLPEAGRPGMPEAGRLPVTPASFPAASAATERPAAVVVAVSLGMLAVAALLVYPVLRYALPLLPSLFAANSLGRALSALILYVFIIVAACAAALIALAVGMLRGSRVAQVLTVMLAAAIAVGVLINGQPAAQGTRTHNGITVLIVLTCAVLIALITLTPSAREFFARDRSPVGVLATAIACVYFGWCISVAGLLLMIAGAVELKFVWWGVTFVLVGAGLTMLSRPLRAGQGWARTIATLGLAGYAVAGLVFAASGGDSKATGTVIQTAIALGVLGLLWLLPSSTRHFASGPHPIGRRLVVQPVSWLALGLVAVIFCAIGLSAHASQRTAASSTNDYLAPPTFAPPSLPVVTSGPTVAAGSLDNTWTVQETAAGGYTEVVTLSVGAPQHLQPSLSQGQLVAGSACSIDSSADAVLPAQLIETNTTSGFATYTAVSFSFGSQWNSPAVEARFTEGPDCETNGYNDHSVDKVQPQARTESDMFFILAGYYTPDHPDGDPSVLANATVQFSTASYTPDDGSAAVEYTPSAPTGAPTGSDGTIPLGGAVAGNAIVSTPDISGSGDLSDSVSPSSGNLPGDLALQAGPLDDGDCSGHTTGQLAEYLTTNGCPDMKRSLYTMTIDGRPAVISVADIVLADPSEVASFAQLSTQDGTGTVLTLFHDGTSFAGAPTSFTDDPTYLAEAGSATGEVVVLQAMWNDGSPTHADDPSLAPVLAQILPTVS